MKKKEEKKEPKYVPFTRRGGPKASPGPKTRIEQEEVIEKLHPMAHTAFAVLNRKIAQGDMKAIQIFMSYYVGLPTQKVENKIEGNLNQVSVEVIKTNLAAIEESMN
jgi:hypothetical protein